MKIPATINLGTSPLAIFRYRNFVLVCSSTTLVGMGTQMEAAVLGWFVLTLTDSPFLVGLISGARMALNFLALFAGAIADRLPRNLLLATVEFTMAVLGILMLALILTGRLEVWHIFAITMIMGMARIFQTPSAQSLIADTLPPERIGNGAAYNTVAMNIAMLIGPLVGGLLYQAYGPQGAYVIIASLYFSSGLFALMVRSTMSRGNRRRESVLRTVIEGLKYARGQQVLWATLLVAVIINLSGWTLHTSLMPIFARDVLGTDAAGLGWLLFAFGLGALTGSLGLAMARNLQNTGKLVILSVALWHSTILVFALSDSFYLSMIILFFTGMAFASTQVLLLTLLLRNTRAEFRGRIMGLRSLAILAFTFGSIASGGVAGLWGAPWAATMVGITGIGLIVILAMVAPKLRQG
ncbi:MAG TPA: MFS transporter [Dehalococcoidia bacterium]|nr:MFS transporter [Dehalococcoidia bacterium]